MTTSKLKPQYGPGEDPTVAASPTATNHKPGPLPLLVQIATALLMLIGTGGAFLIYLVAWEVVDENPDFAYLFWPLVITAWAALACAEVFLAGLWHLAWRARRGGIFQSNTLKWVRLLSACSLAAGILCLLPLFLMPGPFLGAVFVLTCAILCFTLAMVIEVMRSLLAQAVAFRTELDEVI